MDWFQIGIIYIQADSTIIRANKDNVCMFPYFAKLISLYPEHGTQSNPYLLDIDKTSLKHLIEIFRNGDTYRIITPT